MKMVISPVACIEQFPEKALVLPATGGVSLEISCDNGNNQTRAKKSIYTCVPKQYDVGNLTCMTFADSSPYQYTPTQRRRRGVGKLAYAVNEYFNLHLKKCHIKPYPTCLIIYSYLIIRNLAIK